MQDHKYQLGAKYKGKGKREHLHNIKSASLQLHDQFNHFFKEQQAEEYYLATMQ